MKTFIRRTIHWLLFIILAIYVVSGFSITGINILPKALSFKIHNSLFLLVVLSVLLATHIYFTLRKKPKNLK
jgi:cytochrome b561